MTKKRPLGLPSVRLVVVAALAGLTAGAVAVYVKRTGSGNTDAPAMAASGQCQATKAKAATLKPFLKGEVATMTAVDDPRPLSAIAFKGPDGTDRTLADFRGKTVLFNLWATWCVPCRKEMPALDALEKAKGGDDFEVVAVNIDVGSDEKLRTFLSETGVASLAYYRDDSMGVFNAVKKEGLAIGLPATLLFDAEGCLTAAMNGPAEWAGADAFALVDAAVRAK
ncbi:TlpA family protein disulfide reductase [Rhizobiaceae bacterium BDR2-2]|uniref:TlpA family protein disulfide reductase n=1 Tax=Ectorhizobium quercum TaxID=2965071 RepID=A0AAE3N1R3_9HYPH|nr:TlpA disulfide reductase family protein [Ectorhizobium quercum]MCX8999178.1 TlpA family protein disulfide reductase [Ectorhizobium quercum]